ncbi:TMV resistance protein N-like [Dorcoceras hygrometricum]|uniref:TMV resistance protein N-like n=1 Tax=Dorcoceras hygrometricum TaxID=472368 RepID=A0A2Z7A508_9LAMI|nr:TMV resistance protein N-like [Dorcoceras hygrometricum]
MDETLHCWSRALAARWPGGAASLVACEGAIRAFIVRRCWTTMAHRWLRCWSTLVGDVVRRWPDESTLLDDACGALVAHDARWPRDVAHGVVRCRRDFVVVAPPSGCRSGEAPAMSWR